MVFTALRHVVITEELLCIAMLIHCVFVRASVHRRLLRE